jgi:hypothetical protein
MRGVYAQYYAIHTSYLIRYRMSHIPETDLRTTLTGISMWSLTGMQTLQTHSRLSPGLTGDKEQVSGTRYPSLPFEKPITAIRLTPWLTSPTSQREATMHPGLTGAKHC